MWRLLAAFVLVIAIGLGLLWWSQGTPMPKRDVTTAAQLSPDEVTLREELRADVQALAGDIGERNLVRYVQLNAAADFIENSFSKTGLKPRRDSYDLNGKACHNIEIEVPGTKSGIVVVGAHYDSVADCPGANDNASGVAAMLALARRSAGKSLGSSVRFVAFVNEEPPFFQTPQMGSYVYAGRCKDHGDQIVAMISLETIAYFSDAPNSQSYPSPLFNAFYPRVGNFISFVGNLRSRDLLQRAISSFRAQKRIPSRSAALPAFVPGASWSDQWSFWQHGYPGIMLTDTAPFRYPHYHRSTDTPDKLDYDRFALVVSGMQKVISDLIRD